MTVVAWSGVAGTYFLIAPAYERAQQPLALDQGNRHA